ncbi:MAG: hypothetical protein COX57_07325 [Alphaproteobacteria bacterium CG_4_10_14_0_2_um_filter_63_37]|nr:MAG: hypothetical protein AUJ55_02130 [Proteobacteria bacterium CG1_02_64_396]PJA24685.1 MAG: hypothetical protein COX57_07325 [Alphaproteobacteria bacterium CG_4_10_14_0_2_um_filter_63_37]
MFEATNGVNMGNIGQLVEAVKADKGLGKVRFFAESQWKNGTKTEVSISKITAGGQNIARPDRQFTLTVDEPPQLGGTDEAPNPVEYLAAGLCGCLTAGIATNAALFNTKLQGIEVSVELDCDINGVLGLDDAVPNGCNRLHYTVKLTGSDGEEKMIASKEVLDRKSPVLNTLVNTLNATTKAMAEMG